MHAIPENAQAALKDYVSRYVSVNDEVLKAFCTALEYRQLSKKEFLLEAGQVCRHQYFVLSGCFRTFYIDPKGNEQILHFAIENWWMAEYDSFSNERPTDAYIQALEDATVLSIKKPVLEKLCSQYPDIERLFRIIAEKILIATQNRVKFMLSLRREEMLDHFQAGTSPFYDRVPQYMIASYLGFTPEFLSMIRARKKKEDGKN